MSIKKTKLNVKVAGEEKTNKRTTKQTEINKQVMVSPY
jgi:hypothetical protein